MGCEMDCGKEKHILLAVCGRSSFENSFAKLEIRATFAEEVGIGTGKQTPPNKLFLFAAFLQLRATPSEGGWNPTGGYVGNAWSPDCRLHIR